MKKQEQTHDIDRLNEPESVPPRMLVIDRIDIVSAGDKDAGFTDEVLLLIKEVQGFNIPFPLFASFRTPETLKAFIEELIAFRNAVWADAEPVNAEAKLPKEDK